MTIAVNAYVRLKTDPDRSGVVQPGESKIGGEVMIPVLFPNGQVKQLPLAALEQVPSAPESVVNKFSKGQFVDPSWLRRQLTQIRVSGRIDDIIYSMGATNTDFLPYQFKPVLKILNSPTDALLIADEVGLGKTIEAGLIWTELRARFDYRRLLIVCPKTLQTKWSDELRDRFGVNARIVNAEELQELLEKNRDQKGEFAVIATIQALMPPKGWEREEEDASRIKRGKNRRDLARFLDMAAGDEDIIDLLVIDEAHHMRNPQTTYHKLGELLNAVSAYRLFLSATPIHLKNRDLNSLLNLIDEETFKFDRTLEDLIDSNRPILKAREMLLDGSGRKDDILKCIAQAKRHEILRENKTLKLAEEQIHKSELSRPERAELAYRIDESNLLSNYMTRTRRRNVDELSVTREAQPKFIEMLELERRFYEEVTSTVNSYAEERDINKRFLLASFHRMVTSSPAAASAYWSSGVKHSQDELEETDNDLAIEDVDDRPLLRRLQILSSRLAMTEELRKNDSKFDCFHTTLNEYWNERETIDDKIVVFSSFKTTLGYLASRLEDVGIGYELLHGSVTKKRKDILEDFATDPKIKVLLSSEVGSEGVDLQFCRVIVNYDLPWNPMRVEQRIGRIDRIGQKHPKIMIVHLLHNETIDKEIFERLYQRLKLSEQALGGFETVLGEQIREMERRLLDPRLSHEDKIKSIERAAQVAENNKTQNDRLEDEAGALIQHGDYILGRIHEARSLQRWLTEEDVLQCLHDGLEEYFPGSVVEEVPIGSKEYRIRLSEDAREAFRSFLVAKGISFRSRVSFNQATQRYRFSASVVHGESGKVEEISQLHPLVRFIVNKRLQDRTFSSAEAVSATFSLQESGEIHVSLNGIDKKCEPGIYVISIAEWNVRTPTDSASPLMQYSKIAHAGAAVINGNEISGELAELLAVKAVKHGRNLVNLSNDQQLMSAGKVLKDTVMPRLDQQFGDYVERVHASIHDRAEVKKRALVRHREAKVGKLIEQRNKAIAEASTSEKMGDDKKARARRAYAKGRETIKENLNARINDELVRIEQQRALTPEISEISSLFLEITQ